MPSEGLPHGKSSGEGAPEAEGQVAAVQRLHEGPGGGGGGGGPDAGEGVCRGSCGAVPGGEQRH